MWQRRRNYIFFVLKRFKYENTDCSSMEGTAVPLNFITPDDGQVGWNI
jgi:hypothetical protein